VTDRKKQIQDSYQELGGSFATFYDGLVTYSTLPGKIANQIMWGFDENTTSKWLNYALSGIPEDFSGKLLEVPVGTGILTMPLYQTLPNAEITCLDYSADMMANAQKRAECMNISNIDFRQGDVGNLPFPDESFDIVLSLNGFHAFPDKEAAFAETYRVLKKGGMFCGCFYIQGEKKRTDLSVKYILVPNNSFTPPFETKASLQIRLESMYQHVKITSVNAEGIFKCRK